MKLHYAKTAIVEAVNKHCGIRHVLLCEDSDISEAAFHLVRSIACKNVEVKRCYQVWDEDTETSTEAVIELGQTEDSDYHAFIAEVQRFQALIDQ